MHGLCDYGQLLDGGHLLIFEILATTLDNFLKFFFIIVVAVVVAQIINSFIDQNTVERRLKNENNVVKPALLGLVTPGPLGLYLPSLKMLKEKGLSLSMIVAFITSQTLVGPMRSFIEVEYFGAAFFTYRVIFSFFTAVATGVLYKRLDKHLELEATSN
jgi:uncharacterized membrane protein YraQ (UPF0718 family)